MAPRRGTVQGGSPLRATPPAGFTPQLAVLGTVAPTGPGWLHEIKLDGYRIGCRIHAGAIRLFTRSGLDWTTTFPEIQAGVARLPVSSAFLDGEVAVVDPDGRTSFGALQDALSGGPRQGLTYFVFDLLHLDSEDVGALPIEERKQRLRALFDRAEADSRVRYIDHVVGDGPAVFAAAVALGLEGIVSKRMGQPYRAGRAPGWVKTKALLRQELVVGGFTARESTADGIGALLCGTHADDGRLLFAGKVGTGFSESSTRVLVDRLTRLKVDTCPFTPPPDALAARGARWVCPVLVAEVAFRGWTREGRIRHSSFLGLRADKPAAEVKRELPQGDVDAAAARGKKRGRAQTPR
jgi:bifunctional non-homologous end joining protein LigD